MRLRHTFFTALIAFCIIGCCGKTPIVPIQGNAYIPTQQFVGDFTNNPPDPTAHRTLFPIVIDSDFSKEDREQIVTAIAELNYVLNGYMVIMVVQDTRSINDYGIYIEQKELDDQLLGLAIGGIPGHKIQLDTKKIKLLKLDLVTVVIHECGHALFGLNHIEVKNTMMNPYVDYQPICADEIFIQQINSINKTLKKKHMNWCKVKEE